MSDDSELEAQPPLDGRGAGAVMAEPRERPPGPVGAPSPARHGRARPPRPGTPPDAGPAQVREAPAPQGRPAEARRPPIVDPPDDGQAEAATRAAGPGRRRLRWALFALLPIALIAGAYWYVTGGAVMSTDDAYVNAESVGVSTDVSGTVTEVDVTEDQHVAQGQVLYRLDPTPFRIAVDNARANLAQIVLNLDSMKRDYQRMLTDATAQQSQVALDQVTYDRASALVQGGTEARATFDQAKYTLQADTNRLQSLQEQAQVALVRLGGKADTPTPQLPQYQQAKAQLDEAERQLDDATVKAPFAGTVTDVPAIAPGRYLAASATAFYLVDTDHVWVDAQPKETQLTYVRRGQPVTVTVDAYPDVEWHGTVESVSPASSQQFALLPAQNTSGNWVKVVQRIPLRVKLDPGDATRPPLRAGMSVEINVDTGHARGMPHFLAAWL
jgi:membrane fusion protein (multidrug efflux system)